MKGEVNLLPEKGEVFLFTEIFKPSEADALLDCFLDTVPWKQTPVKIFGRAVLQPRLSCSYADPGVTYHYSGVTQQTYPWTKELLQVREHAQILTGEYFNTALLNLYRDGKDYMGWHRDNESALGKEPTVVSVSFGVERIFQLRDHLTKKKMMSVRLNHGSVLVMRGATQHFWEHRLPKDTKVHGPRINITFRRVTSTQSATGKKH